MKSRVNACLFFFVLSGWAALLGWSGQPLLGPLAGLVLLQIALLNLRVVPLGGKVVRDQVLAWRVFVPLQELCARAGCPMPKVVITDGRVRTAAVRSQRNVVSLHLSSVFMEQVDDRALRAVIGHEVAHIARGDLAALRRRSWGAIAAGAAGAAVVSLFCHGAVDLPVYAAAALVGILGAGRITAPANQVRESQADEFAAHLCGDPEALAVGLSIAARMGADARRQIMSPPWYWILYPLSRPARTHPPTGERVAALGRMSAGSGPGVAT